MTLTRSTSSTSSTSSTPNARNGKHSFAFSVGSAATEDFCTELTSRASNLDERVRVLDRKVSEYTEALRTAEATLQSEQEAHTVTKQQLAELGLTSEADLNMAKDALALERAAHAATKADLHALQASSDFNKIYTTHGVFCWTSTKRTKDCYQGSGCKFVLIASGLKVVRFQVLSRNNSFALHNSVLHPWLNQHSRDPKGKDILLFGDKGYGGTGFNLEMSRVRIAVEWAIGGIPTLSPRLNIKKDQCILSSNLVAQYRVCAFMRNALSW
ncbi:unnamed protein product [Tilletia laevis]|nr:unnamed protein product [Tilletia laevis]